MLAFSKHPLSQGFALHGVASQDAARQEPTMDRVMALFRRGAALVDAAVTTLADLERMLAGASRQRVDLAADMLATVHAAAVDGDNLLVRPAGGRGLSTIFALGRSAVGDLRVQTIEIDRDKVALSRADGTGALDVLLCADRDGEGQDAALRGLCVQVLAAASCLSIAKTRLDLQACFLSAVLEPAAAPALFSIGLDQAAVRDLALAARRQLDRQALPLAARNRRTLETLFADVLPGASLPGAALPGA